MPKPAAAPPTASYHHGDLHRALIDTALDIVNEEGAWNFSLREVARRAGVSHAAAYNHFPDKAALLAEVAAQGFEALRLTTEAAARRRRQSPSRQLVAVARAYVEFGTKHPAHYRLMFGPERVNGERHPTLARAGDAAFSVLTETLRRGQEMGDMRRGSVRDQAVAAWSLVHGLTMLFIDDWLPAMGISHTEAGRYTQKVTEALSEGLSRLLKKEEKDKRPTQSRRGYAESRRKTGR
jgi:AcrR family transcriptional regulator